MAFDEGLAERIRECLAEHSNVIEKKMFGGLCFMLGEHMCCGVVGEMLMARVGPAHYNDCLARAHASEMDFTGKAMKGMVYVSPAGIEDDAALYDWVATCVNYVMTLASKKRKSDRG